MKKQKTVSESFTHHVQILSQNYLNGYQRLFGGKLMEWIDIVAAVVARRHCNMNVTTAAVDGLVFKKPAFANDTIVIDGYITYAGTTSMEICVETFIENLDGSRDAINTAYIVMVAIDSEGKPAKVPKLLVRTPQEIANMEAALRRKDYRELRRNEKF